MRNWDERDETGACGATQDFMDVQRVCERLALPCQQVEFVKEYWNEVFRYGYIWLYVYSDVILKIISVDSYADFINQFSGCMRFT